MKKRVIIAIISILSTAALIFLFVSLYANSLKDAQPKITNTQVIQKDDDSEDAKKPMVTNKEMMSLNLFIQDKAAAATTDCGITKQVAYQVPKTTAIADASLKYLFSDELKRYGTYQSVRISNGVATVLLESDTTADGSKIGSLSSCEVRHLLSVITDTLTQYSTVQSIKLSTPQGEIMF